MGINVTPVLLVIQIIPAERFMGGLSASMYFFAVSRWMPTSLATPRIDSPLRFAFCTAFHLVVCMGFLSYQSHRFLRPCAMPVVSIPGRVLPAAPAQTVESTRGVDPCSR